MATPFDFGGLLGGTFGGGLSGLEDLLTPEQRAAIQRQSGLSAAAALLQAAGPSTTRTSLGQALGSAFTAGQAGMQKGTESALTQMLAREKLDEAKRAKTAREEMKKALPGVFQVTTTPEQQTIYGQPAIGVRDEATGDLYPGAEVKPATRQIAIDPGRLQALALLSQNPLESLSQIAKLVPDLRRAGFTTPAAGAATDNPFSVFSADPTISEPVRNIAKQYERSFIAGTLDPDKVDDRVKTLGELVQRSQSSAQVQAGIEEQRRVMNQLKEQGLINQQQHQESMRRLAEQGQAIQKQNQSLQAQTLEIRRDAEANKPEQFSYGQKKEFDVVQKTAAEARSAQDSADIAEKAAAIIPRAYGSKAEAAVKGISSAIIPGFTADAKKANDDLATLATNLTLKAPRFSGPTSNYDAQQYAKAVGDLANPSVSQDSKLKAIQDIKDIAARQADYARQQENYFYSNNKSLRGFKFVPNPFGQ
jgi:hypothetical protein